MSTITISNVILMAREKSDNVNSAFVSDAELIRKINSHWQRLYSIIIDTCRNYYMSTHTITLTSATDYPLPADFFKLIDVHYEAGDRQAPMFPWPLRYQSKLNHVSIYTYPRYYIIKASTIELKPVNTGMAGTVILDYAPEPTAITSAGQTISAPLFAEEWLACSVAMEILGKEESDVSIVANGKAEAERHLIDSLPQRDTTAPMQAVDNHSIDDDSLWMWGVR